MQNHQAELFNLYITHKSYFLNSVFSNKFLKHFIMEIQKGINTCVRDQDTVITHSHQDSQW